MIYCKNCSYYAKDGATYFGCAEYFKNTNIKLIDGVSRCVYLPYIKQRIVTSAIDRYVEKIVYLNDPYHKNNDNKCINYDRKWYKFWIKEYNDETRVSRNNSQKL